MVPGDDAGPASGPGRDPAAEAGLVRVAGIDSGLFPAQPTDHGPERLGLQVVEAAVPDRAVDDPRSQRDRRYVAQSHEARVHFVASRRGELLRVSRARGADRLEVRIVHAQQKVIVPALVHDIPNPLVHRNARGYHPGGHGRDDGVIAR